MSELRLELSFLILLDGVGIFYGKVCRFVLTFVSDLSALFALSLSHASSSFELSYQDVREFEKATAVLPDVEEEEFLEKKGDVNQHPLDDSTQSDASVVGHERPSQAASDTTNVEHNEVVSDKSDRGIKFDAESQSRGGAVKAEGGGGLLSGLQSGVSSLVPSGAPSVPSIPGISSIPGLGGLQEGAGSVSRPELILGSFQVVRMPMPSPVEMLNMMQTVLPAMQAALPGLQGALPAVQSIPSLIGGGGGAAG